MDSANLDIRKAPLPASGIARMIDHTCLRPTAAAEDIRALCEEAVAMGFASVCVHPCYVALAGDLLSHATVKVCSVAGFPLGATLAQVKRFEVEESLRLGAQEIDMVLNLGALKSGQYQLVESDIAAIASVCHQNDAICKVILETALLTREEKVCACVISKSAGADFVKTSTGFAAAGATVEDIALLRATVGPEMGVKASGGIRTWAEAMKMVRAGASRIGTSSGVQIIQEAAAADPPRR